MARRIGIFGASGSLGALSVCLVGLLGSTTLACSGSEDEGPSAGTGAKAGTGATGAGGDSMLSTGGGNATDGAGGTGAGGTDPLIIPPEDPDSIFPTSYEEKVYRLPDLDDAAACSGVVNATAEIQSVYFAQTHPMRTDHGVFFLTADRPALLDVIVTGSGASPEVSVEGFLDGVSLGTLCLGGPAELPPTMAEREHKNPDRFKVTLPTSWLQKGLSLSIQAGDSNVDYSAEELGLNAAPHLNLVVHQMEIMDYNDGVEDEAPPTDLNEELISALGVAAVRVGLFPGRIKIPLLPATAEGTGPRAPVMCTSHDDCDAKNVPEGNRNGAALQFMHQIHRALGMRSFAIAYGDTGGLNPGGWGGGKAFVASDFSGVFLHELGHAVSFPHWSGAFGSPGNGYLYPYGGDNENGGGRGDSWTYIQHLDEFVSPFCEDESKDHFGVERSDGMQRAFSCNEMREDGLHYWDGFGDFSAHAGHRFLAGSDQLLAGMVDYRGGSEAFEMGPKDGMAHITRDDDGDRELSYFDGAKSEGREERFSFNFPQAWEEPVALIYASYHPAYPEVTHIYEPVPFVGGLPEVVDPTDPTLFSEIQSGGSGKYEGNFNGNGKNLTMKVTYSDNSIVYALLMQSVPAPGSADGDGWDLGSSIWRGDIKYPAVVVPYPGEIVSVEMLYREIRSGGDDDDAEGNVNHVPHGLTPETIYDDATTITTWAP